MEENDGNGASSVSRSSDNGSFGSSPSRSEQWQRVLSRPPWILDLLLAFQHVLVLSAALRASFLPLMSPTSPCPSPSLMCTSFLCSGLATLLQLILGSRLPLLHGGSLVAHVPLASITRRSWNDVLDGVETRHWNIANVTSQHVLDTSGELGAALLIAGIVQVVLGIAAMAGRVSDVCGPLVLAPAISLLGLAGYQQSATFSGEHWGLATGMVLSLEIASVLPVVSLSCSVRTITLMLTCSQYLGGVYVPLPRCLSACSIRLPLLRLFSVLLPAGLVWILCIALQVQSLPIRPANLSADCTSAADGATWLQIPSSGRRGAPVFSADAVSCGLTLAILASMETLGCEVLASRLLHCPVPPQHTLSRGLSVQGATTMMAGALSCPAVGVASLPNTCALGLTQEGSRLSVFLASALCILLGLSPRLTLFLTTLPTPAVGGLLCVTHSFAVAAGISYFQYLDINSGRNIFIVGFSLFMALLLPCWLQRHTSGSCTGVPWLDIALHGLLMTPAFLGGFLAFCLDHTVSGTLDERGLMQASTGEPCTDTARNGRPDVLAPPCRFRHFCRGMCPLLKRPSDRGSTSVQFPELDSLTRPTLRISHTDMETSI